MRARKLLVPACVTAAMLAILVGLGVWQLQRLAWKTALLAQIDAAEAAPGIPLPAEPVQFAKVRVSGRFDATRQARYGAEVRDTAAGSVFGTGVIEPLDRPGGDPILVDRGWVPLNVTVPAADSATVDGYVRLPDTPGMFSAKDDPDKRLFYTLDPAKIGAALGLAHVAPFTLMAVGIPRPGVYPQPATALPRPPNDHLNYALTWFGLALSLAAVFGAYARKVFRS